MRSRASPQLWEGSQQLAGPQLCPRDAQGKQSDSPGSPTLSPWGKRLLVALVPQPLSCPWTCGWEEVWQVPVPRASSAHTTASLGPGPSLLCTWSWPSTDAAERSLQKRGASCRAELPPSGACRARVAECSCRSAGGGEQPAGAGAGAELWRSRERSLPGPCPVPERSLPGPSRPSSAAPAV